MPIDPPRRKNGNPTRRECRVPALTLRRKAASPAAGAADHLQRRNRLLPRVVLARRSRLLGAVPIVHRNPPQARNPLRAVVPIVLRKRPRLAAALDRRKRPRLD